MERTISYLIPADADGLRVEQYLKRQGYSRQSIIQLKKLPDGAMLNGQPVFMTERLSAGDHLVIHVLETIPSANIRPVELPLSIVYEDEDLMVVNKPALMPTHPSMHNYENTLANALAWYFAQKGQAFVFRCSNRLDRDTSGLTLIAKHAVSSAILSSMAARKEIRREYLAIVRGTPQPASGTIDVPLGRKAGSIIERTVDPVHGERAVTHYRVIAEGNGHSLIALILETGRTHQIRIHMKYLGYPLIGDYLYNPDMEYIHRQALHSYHLAFSHPITHREMEFYAPLPDDMRIPGIPSFPDRTDFFPVSGFCGSHYGTASATHTADTPADAHKKPE